MVSVLKYRNEKSTTAHTWESLLGWRGCERPRESETKDERENLAASFAVSRGRPAVCPNEKCFQVATCQKP